MAAAISDAAIGLFLAHGFDQVSVARVGRARRPGQSPLDALREHVLGGRVLQYLARSENALTSALAETLERSPGSWRSGAAEPLVCTIELAHQQLATARYSSASSAVPTGGVSWPRGFRI